MATHVASLVEVRVLRISSHGRRALMLACAQGGMDCSDGSPASVAAVLGVCLTVAVHGANQEAFVADIMGLDHQTQAELMQCITEVSTGAVRVACA